MNFETIKLTPWQYEIADRIFNLIGNILTPKWDSQLLGISQLPIKTILDIGANKGQFVKRIVKIFPDADIYAFEPIPDACHQLTKWAARQNKPIKTYQLALGDRDREIEMNLHKMFSASSSLLSTTELSNRKYPMTQKQEKIMVRQKKLDDILSTDRANLIADILIKLDVQGYEDRVIAGGAKIFQQARACIVEISLDRLYQKQANFKTIFTLLSNLGYEYRGNIDQVRDRDGHIIFLNAVLIK